jgi:hypothetical protein
MVPSLREVEIYVDVKAKVVVRVMAGSPSGPSCV